MTAIPVKAAEVGESVPGTNLDDLTLADQALKAGLFKSIRSTQTASFSIGGAASAVYQGIKAVFRTIRPDPASSGVEKPRDTLIDHALTAIDTSEWPSHQIEAFRTAFSAAIQKINVFQDPKNHMAWKCTRIRYIEIPYGKGGLVQPLICIDKHTSLPIAVLPSSIPSHRKVIEATGEAHTSSEKALRARFEPEGFVVYKSFSLSSVNLSAMLRMIAAVGRPDLRLVFVVSVLCALLGLASPLLSRFVIDQAIPAHNRAMIWRAAVALLAAGLANALFAGSKTMAMAALESNTEFALGSAVWQRLLDHPVIFFTEFSSTDLTTRAFSVSQIRKILSMSVVDSVVTGAFAGASLSLLFVYNFSLGILGTAGVLCMFVLGALGSALQLRFERIAIRSQAKTTSLVVGILQGISKIRMASTEGITMRLWGANYGRQLTANVLANKAANLQSILTGALPLIASGGLLLYASSLMSTGVVTTGILVACIAAFNQAMVGAQQLTASLGTVLRTVPYYEQLLPILRQAPETLQSGPVKVEGSGEIVLEDVSFRYRGSEAWAVRNVSIRVPPRKFVAIVGASGSGKSTLLRLILGFERATSGNILIDAENIDNIDLQYLRRHTGVVLQNGRLMPGTIKENLADDSKLRLSEAWDLLRAVGLYHEIQQLPMGLHTAIGSGGIVLSGGQKQRLLLAAALAHKPKILLLDEATSFLDNINQDLVLETLARLDCTRIVIAQRLCTIRDADHIYVMEGGGIIAQGTFQNLTRSDGSVFHLENKLAN